MLFDCDVSRISQAVDYVRDELKKRKIRQDGITRAMLAAEEIMNAMIRHASSAEERINVRVVSFMHNVSVRITCRGTAFDLSEVRTSLEMGEDPEMDAVISDLVSRITGNVLTLRNRNGINRASIQVAAPHYKHLILTLNELGGSKYMNDQARQCLVTYKQIEAQLNNQPADLPIAELSKSFSLPEKESRS